MIRYRPWVALSLMSLAISACSGDDGGGGGSGGSGGSGGGASGSAGKGSGGTATGGSGGGGDPSRVAAHICSEQIGCGYQSLEQEACVELFELLLDAAQLGACDTCVSAEDCDTEQDVCFEICTI